MFEKIANGIIGTTIIVVIYGIVGYLFFPNIDIIYHVLNVVGAFIVLYALYKTNIYIKK